MRYQTLNTKQLLSYLEALKIIVERTEDRNEILNAIEQLQQKLQE
jgi:hypothetical protein